MTTGIHHITAISSNAQKTYDFYTKLLGLRLVKQSVNQDSPDTLHLYFGDKSGQPGTALTFFPFENAGTGMRGINQITTISFAIKKESLGYWLERLISKGIKHNPIRSRFGNKYISFYDYDGLELELVATNEPFNTAAYELSDVQAENQILGFYSATLSVDSVENTAKVLNLLGFELETSEDLFTRFINKSASFAKYIELLKMSGWPEGIQSAGTVHHIAFTSESDSHQIEISKKISEFGLHPTEVIDRYYFKSVYFRVPADSKDNKFPNPPGILFEIATREPGFSVDEKLEDLGKNLMIPEKFKTIESEIKRRVPKLVLDEKEYESHYIFKLINGENNTLLILLHGTGGNEDDLPKYIGPLSPKSSLLSFRGDVSENGLLRFFIRFADGTFDQEDILKRLENFKESLKDLLSKHGLEDKQKIFIGYSNGANFLASAMLAAPNLIQNAILIRPTMPLEKFAPTKALKNSKVLILSGQNDPYTSSESIEVLKTELNNKEYNVTQSYTGEGHEINQNDTEKIFEFLESFN
jgi:predicted esterase/catechol 2,3-dioxygenase-like lactoylglutathione lyase family enzyme